MNKAFEDLIQENADKSSLGGYILIAPIFIASAGLCYVGVTLETVELILIGAIAATIGSFVCIMKRKTFKGGCFWMKEIVETPDNIVWIKPIIVKETVAFVITVNETQFFQLLTQKGYKTTIKCDTEETKIIFLEGLRNYQPHAHIGYSSQINDVYNEQPFQFIDNLKLKGLYTPISILKDNNNIVSSIKKS